MLSEIVRELDGSALRASASMSLRRDASLPFPSNSFDGETDAVVAV